MIVYHTQPQETRERRIFRCIFSDFFLIAKPDKTFNIRDFLLEYPFQL